MKPASRLPAPGRRIERRRGEAGASLVEALMAVAVALILGALSVPALTAQRDSLHAAGAARHVAALVHTARAEALKRGGHVALVFQASRDGLRFAMFADGYFDGVRSADMSAGVDRQVSPWLRIGDQFPGAAFGIVPGAVDPDSGSALTGSPLKLGGSNVLSFGPAGGDHLGHRLPARSGQSAVRRPTPGCEGRSRLLRFDFREKKWFAA